MLNPHLHLDELISSYREDQRVRIDNFLDPIHASKIEECIRDNLRYDYIFFSQGVNQVLSEQKMSSMSNSDRQELQQELLELASRGIGFLYAGYRMDDHLAEAPAVLRDLFQFMNSETTLELISSLTGSQGLKSASGQFTRYSRGHYLTRHLDDLTEERRQLAYVLNFTQPWHPDWGGLLQFYEKNGATRDAWEPRFNSLSLFDVRHIHAVTYVAPHAASSRYALTGWFRN